MSPLSPLPCVLVSSPLGARVTAPVLEAVRTRPEAACLMNSSSMIQSEARARSVRVSRESPGVMRPLGARVRKYYIKYKFLLMRML